MTKEVENGIESVEHEIAAAVPAVEAADLAGAKAALENARQTLAGSVRAHLGIYEWDQ